MNLSLGTCVAEPCGEPATMVEPVRLCDEHKLQVALQVVPDVLANALATVRAANEDGTLPVSAADALPYVVVTIVGLWVISAGADVAVRRRRAR